MAHRRTGEHAVSEALDSFEYPGLGVIVQRGPMGQPYGHSATLDWVIVEDAGEHDSTLTLECALLIDDVEHCRELTVSKISGPAAEDFAEYAKVMGWEVASEVDAKGQYEEERMHDAADALGRALMLDYKERFPTLFVRVLP